MSDLGYALQLAAQMKEREREALPEALDSVANLIGNVGKRDYQSTATKMFLEKGVSPETIQEVQNMYPGVDPKEVFVHASTIEKQREAQQMKDMAKNFHGLMTRTGGRPSEKDFAEAFKDVPPEQMGKWMEIVSKGKDVMSMYKKEYKERDTTKALDSYDSYGNRKEEVSAVPRAETDTFTIYGPNGETKRITREKGAEYVPPEGWTLKEVKTSRYGDFAIGYAAKLKADPKNAGKTDEEIKMMVADEADKRGIDKAISIETGKFGAQVGMIDDTTKEQIYQYYKKTGKYPPEFNRLFRIPGAQMEIIGYVSDKSKLDDITGEDRAETEINWKTLEKASQTANNPTFQRMIKAGKILIEGSTDPRTGQKNEAELDKIIRLRNDIPDAYFGQVSNNLRMFNSWDQFVNYQISDPKMAELKGTVVANAERLGAIYSGGGTVTSDQKIKIALDLLDVKLGKKGFSQLVNSHKDSIRNTIGEYQNITPVAPFTGSTVNQPQAKPAAKKPLSAY
jgi:hypothetical protein